MSAHCHNQLFGNHLTNIENMIEVTVWQPSSFSFSVSYPIPHSTSQGIGQ